MVRVTTDAPTNAAAVKQFTEFLESRQLRKTPERFAILRCALTFVRHFVVDDVLQALEAVPYHVSRTTLYSTLDLLIEAGIVRRHVFDGVPPQYERVLAQEHSHLVCTTCGKVKEVRDVDLAAFMNVRKYNAFTAARYELVVYGTCSACARKQKKAKRR